MHPLTAPLMSVVRMEEGDEWLLAIKVAVHNYITSSCTSGKKGVESSCELRSTLRNQSSSCEHSGVVDVFTSSQMLRAATASMAVNSGSDLAVAKTPEGGSPAESSPQRSIAHPPLLQSTSDPPAAH